MVTIKDSVYLNRWVEMADGTIVKFENQIAQVADEYIGYFKKLKEFEIITPVSDAVPVKTETTPAKTK